MATQVACARCGMAMDLPGPSSYIDRLVPWEHTDRDYCDAMIAMQEGAAMATACMLHCPRPGHLPTCPLGEGALDEPPRDEQ